MLQLVERAIVCQPWRWASARQLCYANRPSPPRHPGVWPRAPWSQCSGRPPVRTFEQRCCGCERNTGVPGVWMIDKKRWVVTRSESLDPTDLHGVLGHVIQGTDFLSHVMTHSPGLKSPTWRMAGRPGPG